MTVEQEVNSENIKVYFIIFQCSIVNEQYNKKLYKVKIARLILEFSKDISYASGLEQKEMGIATEIISLYPNEYEFHS